MGQPLNPLMPKMNASATSTPISALHGIGQQARSQTLLGWAERLDAPA